MTLFLGGWNGPWLPDSLKFLWFFAKLGVLLFFFIWVRWTFPRLRYDQLMNLGWKVLLPALARERARHRRRRLLDGARDDRRPCSSASPALLVVSALMVILHRNPVTSALFLVLAFCSLAGIYLLLHAEFLGMVQVIVYAGAIMVLFLFVIMYLNLEARRRDAACRSRCAAASAGSLGAVLLPRAALLFAGAAGRSARRRTAPAARRSGNTQAIGQLLYSRYLFPFEITSIVLLVAMVGAIVIAKGRAPASGIAAPRPAARPAAAPATPAPRRRRPRDPARLAAAPQRVLFTIGVVGVLVRRNALVIFMSIELMLNAANLAFVAFARAAAARSTARCSCSSS